jgi:hypothetical protein
MGGGRGRVKESEKRRIMGHKIIKVARKGRKEGRDISEERKVQAVSIRSCQRLPTQSSIRGGKGGHDLILIARKYTSAAVCQLNIPDYGCQYAFLWSDSLCCHMYLRLVKK